MTESQIKMNKEENDWKEHKLLILSKLSELEKSIKDLSSTVHTNNKEIKELINADRLKITEFMGVMKELVLRDSKKLEQLASKVESQDKELNDVTIKFKIYSAIIFFLAGPMWDYLIHKVMK